MLRCYDVNVEVTLTPTFLSNYFFVTFISLGEPCFFYSKLNNQPKSVAMNPTQEYCSILVTSPKNHIIEAAITRGRPDSSRCSVSNVAEIGAEVTEQSCERKVLTESQNNDRLYYSFVQPQLHRGNTLIVQFQPIKSKGEFTNNFQNLLKEFLRFKDLIHWHFKKI